MLETDSANQVAAYKEFIMAGIGLADHGEMPIPPASRVTGRPIPVAQSSLPEGDIMAIAEGISGEKGIPLEVIRGARRQRDVSSARHALIQRSIAHGLRPSKIAAFLNVSPSAVSKIICSRE
jgi:hypothetical protein